MLHQERQTVVNQAMARIDGVMSDVRWEMHRETLREQFVQALSIIDRVSHATNKPLILTNLVPGYDLVVARAAALQSVEKAGEAISGQSLMTIDERNLELLSTVFDSFFKTIQQETAVYASADGTYYVGFKSANRAAALEAMGIAQEGVVNVFKSQTEAMQ